jgi:hypothetical protein
MGTGKLILVLAAMAGLLAALSRGLPAHGFFVGDCGVKVTMMFVALERPTTPLEVPPPRIGDRAAPEFYGRFYRAHDDHAHALTSELFPILSAPFVALLGLRGAYVWPALGFLILLPLVHRLACVLEGRTIAALTIFILVCCSPVLFYALEVWEHVPAVTLTAAATLLLLTGEARPSRVMGAGALLGAAFLFRPEAIWYGFALLIVHPRRSLSFASRLAIGGAFALAPMVVFNIVHYPALVSPHISANAALVSREWLKLRLAVPEAWLFGVRAPMARIGLALALAGAGLAWLARSRPRAFEWLRWVALVGIALSAVAASQQGFLRDSLWAVFPCALLALVPISNCRSEWVAALRRVIIVFTLLVALTTPNLGGGQYGPRYLLPMCVPLAILAALAVRDLMMRTVAARVLAGCLLIPTMLGSLAVQRNSYRGELRVTKRIHARIVDRLRMEARDTHYILSDLWWLDQLAASEYRARTFLLADDLAEAREAMRRLEEAGAPPVLIVRSGAESRREATTDWLEGTCYVVERTALLSDRALQFSEAVCRTPEEGEISCQ